MFDTWVPFWHKDKEVAEDTAALVATGPGRRLITSLGVRCGVKTSSYTISVIQLIWSISVDRLAMDLNGSHLSLYKILYIDY